MDNRRPLKKSVRMEPHGLSFWTLLPMLSNDNSFGLGHRGPYFSMDEYVTPIITIMPMGKAVKLTILWHLFTCNKKNWERLLNQKLNIKSLIRQEHKTNKKILGHRPFYASILIIRMHDTVIFWQNNTVPMDEWPKSHIMMFPPLAIQNPSVIFLCLWHFKIANGIILMFLKAFATIFGKTN